jgi:hypothetical protein
MPKNQNEDSDEDSEYSNEETILLQDQIKKMKKELKVFKKNNNHQMVKEYKELIAIKEEECEKIQNALFAEDMKKSFPNCTYHAPRQAK